MRDKIYIIGYIPEVIDQNCEEKFRKTEKQLYQMGFEVINPIYRIININLTIVDAKRQNLNDLMLVNFVYIMPCVNTDNNFKNIELKIAIHFNATIISGFFTLENEKKHKKRIKISYRNLNKL